MFLNQRWLFSEISNPTKKIYIPKNPHPKKFRIPGMKPPRFSKIPIPGINIPRFLKLPNPRDKPPRFSKIPNPRDKYLKIFKNPHPHPRISNPRGFCDLAQNEKYEKNLIPKPPLFSNSKNIIIPILSGFEIINHATLTHSFRRE